MSRGSSGYEYRWSVGWLPSDFLLGERCHAYWSCYCVNAKATRGSQLRYLKGSSYRFQRFLRRPRDKDFDQLPFVFGGAAIIVHGVDFRGGDLSHFTQRGIADPLAVQDALCLLRPHDNRGDRIQTQANVLTNTVFCAERNRNANGGEIFDAARRKFDVRPSGPAGRRNAYLG